MRNLLMVLPLLLFCISGNAQYTQPTSKNPLPLAKYEDNVALPLTAKERALIIEVYGDHAETYVFSKPQMLRSIKQLLRNRIQITRNMIAKVDSQTPKLSEVALFNHYVPSLQRDLNFNPRTFNPLKYNFEFFAKGSKLYLVDGTDYCIFIKSQHQ